ncbi:MAG: uroporphyrinogen decarboxylase family protein [Bacteroidota bacterium]
MNSKERVIQSLNHKQSDKVAVDFGSTPVSGIHVKIVEQLRNHFGLEKRPVKVVEPYQMLGEVDNELREAMGVDVIGLDPRNTIFGFENKNWKEIETFWGQNLLVSDDFKTIKDDNGDLLIYPKGDTSAQPSGKMPKSGYFFDTIVRQHPIDEDKLDVEDNLEEFDYLSDDDLAYWKKMIDKNKDSDKAIIANMGGTALGDIALVPAPFLTDPKGIRDITEWYMSTVMRTDYLHGIFEKQTEIAIKNMEKFYGVVGNNIDALFICGTDFGTQDSSFCAPEQYDELWHPYYKRINDWIHQNTTWKSFKHSCGAVENFMPHFIESGFDIINPVQISAAGMEPNHLKKEYGKDLVFWGGGVDTQNVLPFGTPNEVEQQVVKQCEILGKDGGFVFNSIHNVQANVPFENVLAMLKGIEVFNGVGVGALK